MVVVDGCRRVGVVGVAVQEIGHLPGHVGGVFEQEQVSAAGHDVQPGVRDAVREDPAVQRRDEGVVVTGEDERGLSEPCEPRQRGPEADRVELAEVAAQARCSGEPGQGPVQERVGVGAGGAAEQVAGDPPVVAR